MKTVTDGPIKLWRSRLQIRLVGWIALFSVIFLIGSFVASYSFLTSNAKSEALHICRMINKYIESSQDYVMNEIRPVMYDNFGTDVYYPEVMSGTFISRCVTKQFQHEYPDIYFKFATDNPRNPENLASKKEMDIIRDFRDDGELEEWTGIYENEGIKYFCVATPIYYSEACNHCHGYPSTAPEIIIERYGNVAGFYNRDDAIAIRTVGIPISAAFDVAKVKALSLGAFTAVFLLCLLVLATVLMNRWVIVPLSKIRKGAISLGQNKFNKVVLNTNDEIQELAEVFNEIAEGVEHSRFVLEQKVKERTEELNERMNELELFNQTMVGRELKMIELKKEINELLKDSGENEKYVTSVSNEAGGDHD